MTTESQNTGKDMLGYRLQRRLGSGAYGEVWSAVAPGGITKAVKLIYGYHDERRAQNELKSLNRIKEVRHPFLLSLERIEVVNGQLIVISELAEMSLKDRFDNYRTAGESGIPRHELLGYMRDAADALDYISGSHSLQHLDVKPENLLLMSGHVKVADFGLVKDVQEATLSMMAGLTPAYASPEMFDGRPGKASDQYSLAIVYQEMLTGVRPFSGSTAAQLAAQHLKGRPQLDSLPRGDQAVIARALSKNPEMRFANCSEMVEELANPKKRSTPQRRRRLNPALRSEEGADAVPTQLHAASDNTMSMSGSAARIVARPVPMQALPALELPAGTNTFHPTLVLAVGTTGTSVLRKFKRRLNGWLGGTSAVPAMRLLALDVDMKALSEATRDDIPDALAFDQALHIPLRRSEDYRNDAGMHHGWLSRRWIYNVPRTLQTEGIRPLGRLAFVDHSEHVLERIQAELKYMTQPALAEQSAKALGFDEVDVRPRIIVVGSIAGGTGGGIMVDMGYAMRTLLAELDMRDDKLIGILISMAARNVHGLDLTVGNTLATLTELNHHYHAGYPGDESCGLPAFESGVASYAFNYLVPFHPDDFETGTDSIAEYIYLSTASKCGRFFDAARVPADSSPLQLRTIGLSHTGLGGDTWSEVPSQLLSHQVVRRWMKHDDPLPRELQPHGFVAQHMQRLNLTVAELRNSLAQVLNQALGGNSAVAVMQFARAQSESEPPSDAENTSSRAERYCAIIDAIEAPEESSVANEPTEQLVLEKHLTKHVRTIIDNVAQQISLGIADLVNHPAAHLTAAIEALAATKAFVDRSTEEVTQRQQADLQQRHQVLLRLRQLEAAEARKPAKAAEREAALLAYAELRVSEFLWAQLAGLFKGVEAQLGVVERELSGARRELDQIIHRLQVAPEVLQALSPDAFDVPTIILNSVVGQIPEHVKSVDDQLRMGFLRNSANVHGLLTSHTYVIDEFIAALLSASQRVLAERMKDIQVDRAIRESGLSATQIAGWVEAQLQAATPGLDTCGGASRLMLGLPENSSSTALAAYIEKQHHHSPTVVSGTRGDVVVCFEVDQIPIQSIAYHLLVSQPLCCDLVPRLLSRIDVEWSSLTESGIT